MSKCGNRMPRLINGLFVLWLLTGCAPGKHSFQIVQACLNDEGGVQHFVAEMRSIAAAENMSFTDDSARVAQQLRDVGYQGKERTHGSKEISVSVQRSDGVGVSAGNLGLPGFEIALGFSEGSDAAFARAFADRVVARLGTQWQFSTVSPGAGAKPIGGCP